MEEDKVYNNLIAKLRNSNAELDNPYDNVNDIISRIENPSIDKMPVYKIIVRYAAAILLIISIGSFAWQETSMRFSRVNMLAQMNVLNTNDIDYHECKQKLDFMVAYFNKYEALPKQVNEVTITINELNQLKAYSFPGYPSVDDFLTVLHQYYPADYDRLYTYGEVKLSISEMKSNQYICELLTKK